jgi:hypothetical protein
MVIPRRAVVVFFPRLSQIAPGDSRIQSNSQRLKFLEYLFDMEVSRITMLISWLDQGHGRQTQSPLTAPP